MNEMGETRTEKVGPGICDGCGEQKPALTAIYCAPVAGLCMCDDCLTCPGCLAQEIAGTKMTPMEHAAAANGGLPYVTSGKVRAKPQPVAKPARICLQWPEANKDTKRAGVWMHKPDTRPKATVAIKRRQGAPIPTSLRCSICRKRKRHN